jgi:hypothetical protein
MNIKKQTVHSLWIGENQLDAFQLLTLKSFSEMGAEFNLWTYDDIKIKNIKNVLVKNANEIIEKEKIFKYPSKMLLGFGQNSYVGFSELFRYKVLYELGGWWSDMDVVCLKPLEETTDEYWFRFHGILSVVGNIMKCPPKSELMRLCYDRAIKEVNSEQDDWHHAIRILCFYIEYLDLEKFIHKYECNLDRVEPVRKLLDDTSFRIPEDWKFIHWMNSVIDKNYVKNSVLDVLYKRHNIKTFKSFI